MRPATVRRLVVLGVCSLGVAALYLAPSVARSPQPITRPPVSGTSVQSTAETVSYASGRPATRHTGANPLVPPAVQPAPRPEHRPPSSAGRSRGATAYEADAVRDEQPPSAVTGLTPVDLGPDRLTVRWSAAQDNVGVSGYRLWLNGFPVAETAALEATLTWFSDGSRAQVVQVRARDAAGNLSVDAATILLDRPPRSPSPSPTSPSPTPTPTAAGRSEPASPTPSEPTANSGPGTSAAQERETP